MTEKSDGKMYFTINWNEKIADVAGPMLAGDTRESWLARAARRSGLSFRTIKSLYYGECKDPKSSVALRVLGASEAARNEAAVLAARFETLAGALHAKDEDFHSSDVLALIHAARSLRGLDRP